MDIARALSKERDIDSLLELILERSRYITRADAGTPVAGSCGARVMHIEYERTGGFAGMTMSASVDVDSLPAAESDEVCRLVDDAKFFDLPNSTGDAGGADQFGYSITVDDGDRRNTVVTNDGTVPAALRPLLDWLNRAARRKR